MQQKLKKVSYWLGTIIIGFILGFSLQFVKAWTEPSATAPNGNVSAPINISATSQYKSGALGIGGLLRGYSDVMGNRLCIGADCRSTWPATGLTNGVSAGYPYTSINNDNGNGWPEYSDSTYGGSNFSNWPDYADNSGSTYGGSNFSYWPNYAYSAGNSDTLDGWHRDDIRANATGGSVGYATSTYGGSNFSAWPNYAYNSGWTAGGSRFDAWPNYAYSAGNSDTVDGLHASSFASRGAAMYQCRSLLYTNNVGTPCLTSCVGQITSSSTCWYGMGGGSDCYTYTDSCSFAGYLAN